MTSYWSYADTGTLETQTGSLRELKQQIEHLALGMVK